MVRFVKLIFPYAQLAFIGWVVWTADAPEWQTVAAILLLAWAAVGITMLRIALSVISRAAVKRLLLDMEPVTKPRHLAGRVR